MKSNISDDTNQLVDMQKNDPEFKHIYKYLSTNQLPEDEVQVKIVSVEKEHYDIVDDVLIHRYEFRGKKKPIEERTLIQIALPKALRLKAMKDFHDHNGHFGIKKTYAAIQLKYYWPKMFQEISDFVRSCEICQRVKRHAHPNTYPLNPLPVAGVFERLHLDIIGPLHKTSSGNEYILVCVDSFSRWVEAFPLKNQTASEMAVFYTMRYSAGMGFQSKS